MSSPSRTSRTFGDRLKSFKMIFGLDIAEKKKREAKEWQAKINQCSSVEQYLDLIEKSLPEKWRGILSFKDSMLSFDNFAKAQTKLDSEPWKDAFDFFLIWRKSITSTKKGEPIKSSKLSAMFDTFVKPEASLRVSLQKKCDEYAIEVLKTNLAQLDVWKNQDPNFTDSKDFQKKMADVYDWVCDLYMKDFFKGYLKSEEFKDFQRCAWLEDGLTSRIATM